MKLVIVLLVAFAGCIAADAGKIKHKIYFAVPHF